MPLKWLFRNISYSVWCAVRLSHFCWIDQQLLLQLINVLDGQPFVLPLGQQAGHGSAYYVSQWFMNCSDNPQNILNYSIIVTLAFSDNKLIIPTFQSFDTSDKINRNNMDLVEWGIRSVLLLLHNHGSHDEEQQRNWPAITTSFAMSDMDIGRNIIISIRATIASLVPPPPDSLLHQ